MENENNGFDNGQTPSTQANDDTASNQTAGFKQPEQGSDQQIDSAGETTTLGQDGTDIEGSEPTDGSFVGSQGQSDTSSELVDNTQIDKDGQPPLDGE